jgi:hypothetical protein
LVFEVDDSFARKGAKGEFFATLRENAQTNSNAKNNWNSLAGNARVRWMQTPGSDSREASPAATRSDLNTGH